MVKLIKAKNNHKPTCLVRDTNKMEADLERKLIFILFYLKLSRKSNKVELEWMFCLQVHVRLPVFIYLYLSLRLA